MAIGDGNCDPVSMMNYGDFLLSVGLVDRRQRDVFRKMEDKVVDLIHRQEGIKAFEVAEDMLFDSRKIGHLESTLIKSPFGKLSPLNGHLK